MEELSHFYLQFYHNPLLLSRFEEQLEIRVQEKTFFTDSLRFFFLVELSRSQRLFIFYLIKHSILRHWNSPCTTEQQRLDIINEVTKYLCLIYDCEVLMYEMGALFGLLLKKTKSQEVLQAISQLFFDLGREIAPAQEFICNKVLFLKKLGESGHRNLRTAFLALTQRLLQIFKSESSDRGTRELLMNANH